MTRILLSQATSQTILENPLLYTPIPTFGLKRALGSGQEATTSTSTSNGVRITETLFPTAHSPSGRNGLPQSVLEWVFAVIALGLLSIFVIWRYICMKYRNRRGNTSVLPYSRGRRSHFSHSPTQSLQQPQSAYISEDDRRTQALILSPGFLYTGLMPLVDERGVRMAGAGDAERRTRGRRVLGMDVDEGGRRGGNGGSEDGHTGAVDELPVYEVGKGPPGYHTVTTVDSLQPPGVVQVAVPQTQTISIRSVQSPQDEHHNTSPNTRSPAAESSPVLTQIGDTQGLQPSSPH